MGRKKLQKSKSVKVFEHDGQHWTIIHSDNLSAWIVPFNVRIKAAGGAVKKVDLDFTKSKEFSILAI